MNNFKWTKNIVPGDLDGGSLYWRVKARLEDDPLASMFHERVLEGIALAAYEAFTTGDDHIVWRWVSPFQVRANLKHDIFPKMPLGWVGDRTVEHLIDLVVHALYPAGETTDGVPEV